MYELNDTIVAVSSPTSDKKVIVRITGPNTIDKVEQVFSPRIPRDKRGLIRGSVAIDDELRIDAKLYLFLAPNSYTGETLAEIHIHTNSAATEALMASLLAKGLRMAGPGEFTARAYLNGKIDLAQAEAVNEIITSSNKFQLAAAEKLLSGRLAETTEKIRSELMDCLSLIEAGLDFSGEDIEFISRPEAVERLVGIRQELEQLLSGNISYESVIDLPAVGIAGAPNAGKSSLLNKLLGRERSIVSEQSKTTRDVLTGLLTLRHCRCVLFDCAGLMQETRNILDELAQHAANESLRKALAVVFCVDVSKDAPVEWGEDIAIRKLIESEVWIAVATKSDLLSEDVLAKRLGQLGELFGVDFIATSAKDGTGVEQLKDVIDERIIELALGGTRRDVKYETADARYGLALTARHKQAVTEAIASISESVDEVKAGNDEVAAMMLRAGYQALSNIEQQHIDEQILERIFHRFCIGK
ncbi:MAG: tRNA modification GTPase [Planctomycetota bacterium]|jgi:tRNA modification GTPase